MSEEAPVVRKCTRVEGGDPLTVIHPIHGQTRLEHSFVHALSLAFASKGELEIVDVRREKERTDHIGIRTVLEQWGLIHPESSREDVYAAGLRVKKIIRAGSVRKELGNRLRRRPHDILVLGLKAASGFHKFLGQDIIEYLVQYFRQTTLYIPDHVKPFVDERTGEVTLRSIVVPVAANPSSEASFRLLQRILKLYPEQSTQIYGIHQGEIFPYVSAAALEGFSWQEHLVREKPLVKSIQALAIEKKADLIVMATNGRDTLQQRIVGSITEQVLKATPCPVLAVAVA